MATPEAHDPNFLPAIEETRAALEGVPPQRRAQLLLLNMAGLTTRLIELSGQNKMMTTQFLAGAVLPPEGLAASNPKDVFNLLDSYQSMLFDALAELAKLQEMENEKQRIADMIAVKDATMRDFAKRLREAQQVLESTLEEFETYKRPKKVGDPDQSSELLEIGLGTINVQELVAYSHRISYTTFAPPEYPEGAPLRGALPPAPQDEQMRASKLYQINDLDLGMPKPAPRAASPIASADLQAEVKVEGGATPQQARVKAASMLPTPPPGWKPGMSLDLPPMPAGWKPGDPVPFPPDMPPMPPAGWKPGDEVVLPPTFAPFPGAEGGAPPGHVRAPAVPAVPLAPPSAPIFVPFVNLDLNPELEDPYGSDYSDEDGSSEDEDE